MNMIDSNCRRETTNELSDVFQIVQVNGGYRVMTLPMTFNTVPFSESMADALADELNDLVRQCLVVRVQPKPAPEVDSAYVLKNLRLVQSGLPIIAQNLRDGSYGGVWVSNRVTFFVEGVECAGNTERGCRAIPADGQLGASVTVTISGDQATFAE